MSQCLLRSDTVIYDAATQCPVDELVQTFHLVYRYSSVCQFPADTWAPQIARVNTALLS